MKNWSKKIARGLVHTIFSILLFIVVYLNIRLYYSPSYSVENKEVVNEDILAQLHYLKQKLHNGGGELAQKKYPEGFIFLNALYGLTWADFIDNLSSQSIFYKEGIQEINWAYKELDSQYGRMWFPNDIIPSRGIFYRGWKNYVLGKKLSLQNTIADSLLFSQECDTIYAAFNNQKAAYLESYTQLVWPADNLVAIASLVLHDKLYPPKYEQFIQNWLSKVKTKLDTRTGLIPHEVVYGTEETHDNARGSSQSLMLNFLVEIDSSFGRQQLKLYKKFFLDYRFGLPGMREYPKGSTEGEDVDSGPVIMEIGGAASLVGQRTMALYGEAEISVGLRNCIEAFGAAYTWGGDKRYVLGLEPIADAFIAWSNVVDIRNKEQLVGNWRWNFQILSLGCVLLLVVMWYFLHRVFYIRKLNSDRS